MSGTSDLDEAALRAWLGRRTQGFDGELTIEKFAGGQSNPTYRLSHGSGSYVLRRKPFGDLLPSAHAVDREYRLLEALHPTGFAVPRPIALCLDADVLGSIFYIMELVEGRTFWDGALPDEPLAERSKIYLAMVDTLAQLHSIDPISVGLQDFGRPGNYFERQVRRWAQQYRSSQTEEIEDIDRLISWLSESIPDQTRTTIIHGDYRIDNLIYDYQEPVVSAVLDWELSTIGDPIADFANIAMNWLMPADGGAGLAGLDLAAEGLPALDEMINSYCLRTGRDSLPDLQWYFAFGLFRVASILQGVKKRMTLGNASSDRAEAAVARIRPLAEAGWREACKAVAR